MDITTILMVFASGFSLGGLGPDMQECRDAGMYATVFEVDKTQGISWEKVFNTLDQSKEDFKWQVLGSVVAYTDVDTPSKVAHDICQYGFY